MEKKNKKKLFAIIGGSVLAFVLTIALSVSITLAYFGGTDSGDTTVTMDTAVSVGHSSTIGETVPAALPGQGIDVDATATITAGTNGAFLAAKVDVTDTNNLLGSSDITLGDGWVKGSDNYWYWVGTGVTANAEGADKTAVASLANAATASLTARVVISPSLVDDAPSDASGKDFKVTVTFVAVQGKAFHTSDSTEGVTPAYKAGDEITTPTIADIMGMVSAVNPA